MSVFDSLMRNDYSAINIVALLWFCSLWLGYMYFAKYRAKQGFNLSYVLNRQRHQWMQQVLERDNRVSDASLIANLERNTSFLASTSILVLAGLLTALGITDSIDNMLQSLPFYPIQEYSAVWMYIKIFVLILIYIYAFFSLTWSMRQYGFASVMIGSAPQPYQVANNEELKKQYVYASAKVIDMAAHAYNYGLRAYYFSLAILPWFISPLLLFVSTALVVIVLYIREFHSRPYHVIKNYLAFCDELDKKGP